MSEELKPTDEQADIAEKIALFFVGESPEQCVKNTKALARYLARRDSALLSERDARIAGLREALDMLYRKWENGDDCYEDPGEFVGHLGKAFNLSDEEQDQVEQALNSSRPILDGVRGEAKAEERRHCPECEGPCRRACGHPDKPEVGEPKERVLGIDPATVGGDAGTTVYGYHTAEGVTVITRIEREPKSQSNQI